MTLSLWLPIVAGFLAVGFGVGPFEKWIWVNPKLGHLLGKSCGDNHIQSSVFA